MWKCKEMKENLEWIVASNRQGTSENLRLSKSMEELNKEEEKNVG